MLIRRVDIKKNNNKPNLIKYEINTVDAVIKPILYHHGAAFLSAVHWSDTALLSLPIAGNTHT